MRVTKPGATRRTQVLISCFLLLCLVQTGSCRTSSKNANKRKTRSQRHGSNHNKPQLPTTHNKNGADQVRGPSDRNHAGCPFVYNHQPLYKIKDGSLQPYLFGGVQQPECKNCKMTKNWQSNFCQFKSDGPICPRKYTKALIQRFISRGMTELVSLSPCDLWPFLSGHALWIIGDSMALDFFKAVKCFMMEFFNLEAEEAWQTLPKNDTLLAATISTILPPACVVMPNYSRICYIRVDKGSNMVEDFLPIFSKLAGPGDVASVNFGLHHGDWNEYNDLLKKFGEYVKHNRDRLPRIFWQETSAQHFNTIHGEWPGGSPPYSCSPLSGVKLHNNGHMWARDKNNPLLQGGWRNQVANEVMRAYGVPIIASFNETVPLYKHHRDNGQGHECTHFCFPSAPEVWVYALYKALREAAGVSHTVGDVPAMMVD